MNKKPLLAVMGATGVGKSAVAVELAHLLNTEVVSADSMQVYKYMDIGTAKLTDAEMRGIKHRMIDVLTPDFDFSAYQYGKQVKEDVLPSLKSIPLFAGGTGFYLDALLYPPEFGGGSIEELAVRNRMYSLREQSGDGAVADELKRLDKATYDTIDKANIKRVIRAIEIASLGERKSCGVGRARKAEHECLLFILSKERNKLYDAVNKRVDSMVDKGLFEETEMLLKRFGDKRGTAFQAIGYKEAIQCLEGSCTKQDAVDRIKINTRHYVKRQITYFKKMNVCEYVDVELFGSDAVKIASYVADRYSEHSK